MAGNLNNNNAAAAIESIVNAGGISLGASGIANLAIPSEDKKMRIKSIVQHAKEANANHAKKFKNVAKEIESLPRKTQPSPKKSKTTKRIKRLKRKNLFIQNVKAVHVASLAVKWYAVRH